jgi:hypothetical protein
MLLHVGDTLDPCEIVASIVAGGSTLGTREFRADLQLLSLNRRAPDFVILA